MIIPALNEEASIGKVLAGLPQGLSEVIVVDNGSSDATAERARGLGATVVYEPRRGYGSACLRGLGQLAPDTGIVVFMDADYSDHADEMPGLISPIQGGQADMVIGSRLRGLAEAGSLMPVARFGNWLATSLIRWIWGERFTDLGPFRAIRWDALQGLQMRDTGFGWTVEMQVKAAARRLRCLEIPVSYRCRIGKSKISGTILGSVRAGMKILYIIARESLIGKHRIKRPPLPRQ